MLPRTLIVFLGLTSAAVADVIHTADGRTLAGPTTVDGDVLVVETLAGRETVALAEVASQQTAASLLADLKQQQQRLRPSDWAGALRIADLAIQRGLFDEGVAAADRALLAIARLDDPPRFALPPQLLRVPLLGVRSGDPLDAAATQRLLDVIGEARRPAAARIARARLANPSADPTIDPAIDDVLLAALTHAQAAVREAALDALARRRPERALDPVAQRMLFDVSPEVRKAAIDTVAAYQVDAVATPLVRALQSDDAGLRGAAMDAIETLGTTRAVGALVRNLRRADGGSGGVRGNFSSLAHTSYVSDFDVEIAQAAVIGQPVVKVLTSGVVQDATVAGVYDRFAPAERRRIVSLLAHLTGQQFGADADAWSDWLHRQQKPVSQDG